MNAVAGKLSAMRLIQDPMKALLAVRQNNQIAAVPFSPLPVRNWRGRRVFARTASAQNLPSAYRDS
jgi:hypothetical protein